MNKLIIPFLFIVCLTITACNNGIFVEPLPDIPQEIYRDGFEDAPIDGAASLKSR